MSRSEPSDLTLLRTVLDERESMSAYGLDGLGLFLMKTLVPSTYSQTPDNCLPFAATGGDGVHYSFADIGSGYTDASPVVMTVPMNFDRPNLVVGNDLRDFLALGLRLGYFVLEGLVYDRDKWVRRLAQRRFPDTMPDEETGALRAIEAAFAIAPWADPESHVHDLQERYAALLQSGA